MNCLLYTSKADFDIEKFVDVFNSNHISGVAGQYKKELIHVCSLLDICLLYTSPVIIADAILGLTNSKVLFLLLINVLLLIVGTFIETNAAIIILTPILLPIVTRLGVDPIHFGIIVVMNLSEYLGTIRPLCRKKRLETPQYPDV